MTVHSTEEARLRARVAAHARRLFIEGKHRSMPAFAKALGIDQAQVWRVLTGERTPGIGFIVALRAGLGLDLNQVLTKDPPPKWFRPLARRPAIVWE